MAAFFTKLLDFSEDLQWKFFYQNNSNKIKSREFPVLQEFPRYLFSYEVPLGNASFDKFILQP